MFGLNYSFVHKKFAIFNIEENNVPGIKNCGSISEILHMPVEIYENYLRSNFDVINSNVKKLSSIDSYIYFKTLNDAEKALEWVESINISNILLGQVNNNPLHKKAYMLEKFGITISHPN